MRTRRAATHVLLALMCGALASSMVMLDAPKAQAAGPTTSQDVERQVAARAALGLPTDPTYVAGVAADSTADTSFGVPLTPAEIADLRARPDAAALDPMVSFARRHPADYGGTYIDQAAGGIVDVALTGSARLRTADLAALLPAGVKTRFRSVRWSEQDLTSATSAITKDMPVLEASGIVFGQVYPDVVTNRVVVAVIGDVAAATRLLTSKYGPIVDVRPGTSAEAMTCTRQSCPPPWRGGLQINSTTHSCSSGYVARVAGGGLWYLITAGHCDDNGSINLNWYNGSAFIGSVVRSGFHDYSAADALAIAIGSNTRSNYYWVASTDTQDTFTTWAGGTVGEIVCKSGNTTGETCGGIQALGVTVPYDGKHFVDQTQVSMWIDLGDSGGPVFDWNNPHKLLGTVTAGNPQMLSWFSTVYDEMQVLAIAPCTTMAC